MCFTSLLVYSNDNVALYSDSSNESTNQTHGTIPLYVNLVRLNACISPPPVTKKTSIQNAPFSALVCGVQGSGKSHTVCTLLENAMISGDRRVGSLQTQMSGLVLHFGDGGKASLPCEAAALSSSSSLLPSEFGGSLPNVSVFVSSSSLNTMRGIYSHLGDHVSVKPLKFAEKELDSEAFRAMMAVGSSESIPLYMHTVLVCSYCIVIGVSLYS